MKAHIGPYVNWIGPYQIADKVFFWVDKYPELREDKGKDYEKRWDYRAREWLGDFLAHGFHKETPEQKRKLCSDRHKTWFYKLLQWIHSKQKRVIKIKTDPWVHWNAEHTISLLVLPILKDLREHKHGAGYIDDEDVPEHLRSTAAPPKEHEWDIDDNHFDRFDWVLNEIIWAHEQIVDDNWEEQYTSGECDWEFKPCEDRPEMSTMVEGPKHTYTRDEEAIKKHQERISNGLRLFGKYYQTLWD